MFNFKELELRIVKIWCNFADGFIGRTTEIVA
jgi:hypothetical protein